jgi:hypothetical protein
MPNTAEAENTPVLASDAPYAIGPVGYFPVKGITFTTIDPKTGIQYPPIELYLSPPGSTDGAANSIEKLLYLGPDFVIQVRVEIPPPICFQPPIPPNPPGTPAVCVGTSPPQPINVSAVVTFEPKSYPA